MIPIYLDYNSTTPVDPMVLETMLPYFTADFGNAASKSHLLGWAAEDAVAEARATIAKSFSVHEKNLIFTSGSTEAINLGIKGFIDKSEKKHIVTVSTEHKAVLDTIISACKVGASTTILEVDKSGKIDLDKLESSITSQTALVAIMLVNNETGLIHPIAKISEICHQRGTNLFCDATQAVGKMELNPKKLGIDMLVCSAHKIYGPKGVGMLYVNEGIELEEQISGGGHERGRRSGTLNVPGIVGFAKAIELSNEVLASESKRVAILRDRLETGLLNRVPGSSINGNINSRIWNTTNIYFPEWNTEDLFLKIGKDLAVSSGSACTSATVEPSHVLLAMGLSQEKAMCSIRFSLGRGTTEEEIDRAVEILVETV